jgi:hypothetical protein
MDAKKATQLILAIASVLGTTAPSAAEPRTGTKGSASPTTGEEPVATREVQAVQFLAAVTQPLYGIMPVTDFGKGSLAETVQLAANVREALALAATPAGRAAAPKYKLTEQKVGALSASLAEWDESLAALSTKAGQILQPLYGIKVDKQSRTGNLASMQRMSNEIHDALAVLETVAGKAAAESAGISVEHIGTVRTALVKLDQAIGAARAKSRTAPKKTQ